MKLTYVRDEDHAEIKAMSVTSGVSMAELIHQAVRLLGVDGLPKRTKNARQLAIELGNRTYMGEPCGHGHRGERITKTAVCVSCKKLRSKFKNVPGESMEVKLIRQAALEARETTYRSDIPCTNCYDMTPSRRVKSGLCANCWSGDGVKIS